ncbi:MMOB1640 family gliding machinery internal complex protein [[Mycoplasma] mobile]|uniref:Expressed protein n=1 Tax=Mycoplasma mobile (strain ATCC 43663 / 163K / NCTC 11711) TaxID=267748 RepID=Q6KIC6_MYCM1|nr:hypothetical protein [[Mycoplasma] mobile]AAT27650.1 expressed protein [Mycoplasma mobile 163K]
MNNISIHTTNPRDLKNIYDHFNYKISKATIYSIDNKTLVLNSNTSFNKDLIQTFDVALLTLEISIKSDFIGQVFEDQKTIKTHVLVENLMLMINNKEFLFLVNGKYDVISENKIVQILQEVSAKEFSKESVLEKIENELTLSSNLSVIRAYNQLSDYFTAEKYSFNNNVFKLLAHQAEALKIAKKILLKNLSINEISR